MWDKFRQSFETNRIDPAEQDRRLRKALALRLAFAAILWLIITLPTNPGWSVSADILFHVAFAVVFLGYVAALSLMRKRRHLPRIVALVSLSELIAVSALVATTGGPTSPFAILYLFIIQGTVYQGNVAYTTYVSLLSILLLAGLVALIMSGLLPRLPAFTGEEPLPPLFSNTTFLVTAFGLVAAYVALTLGINLTATQRLNRQSLTMASQSTKLTAANRKLRESFHDMESMADRLVAVRADAEAAREELLRADSLALLGRMSAGLVGELGDPLTSIVMEMEMLLSLPQAPVGDDWKDPLRRVLTNAERIRELVQDLRDTVRPPESVRFEAVDVNAVVRRDAQLIAPELDHKGVALHLKLTDDLPPVVGVASQVELVLLNLLANAGEACANGSGRIEVETYAVDDEVRLVVRDNGEGMSENDQARAFEPFSTTKDKSQHLGLGLYLVQRLVEAHLGYVLIESAPGGPTAVTVAIPAAENTDPLLHLEEETS